MGKCLDCGAPIEDGEQYCESCLLLRDLGLSGDDIPSQERMDDNLDDMLVLDDSNLVLDDMNLDADVNVMPADDMGTAEELNIDEDILSFLNSSEEESARELSDDDLDEINSLLAATEGEEAKVEEPSNERNNEIAHKEEKKLSKSSDVGDILSDALGVLNDPAMDELEKHIMEMMPEENIPEDTDSKEKASKKVSKKTIEKANDGEKTGWFKKLFSNVPGPEPDENAPSEEELEQIKKAKAEEKKKQKSEKKKEKKAAQDTKKKQKKQEKTAKAAEKKRIREEMEKSMPVDTSRINKAGASIIFVFAAVITVFVIVGTNTFTYTNVVKSASNYLNQKQYTKAYQQIAGVNIKEKDEILYDKIVTIMYVNKQYNSYENYFNMEMYPESLDSLIKGLERYQKYKSQASELEIMDDMNYVKANILEALNDSFQLKENDVQYLMDMESQEKYSDEVIKLAKH